MKESQPWRTAVRAAGLCALLQAAAVVPALAAEWRLEPAGSRLEIIPSFERAPVPATVRDFDVRLELDPARPAQARLEADVAVSSTDFGMRDVNLAIRGPEWFDFSRFPQAEFRAAGLRQVPAPAGASADAVFYVAAGTLTLKGVSRAVELPFGWREQGEQGRLSGAVTLLRADFGIGQGEWAATDQIGAEVQVRFDLRLRRLP